LPKESYINIRTAAVLQHEQGHLDITEIYARRLRAFLSKHQKCNHHDQALVSKYYDQLIADWQAEEVLYDKETDYSRQKEQQAAWLEKIATELSQ
jgi:predicted secreted Zn-dependent protease